MAASFGWFGMPPPVEPWYPFIAPILCPFPAPPLCCSAPFGITANLGPEITDVGGGPLGKGGPEPAGGRGLSYCVMFVSGFQ
jgi:hypothetical protein